MKKELFPVVGPDGIARALFHYHLLELDAAGIEEICIIVQPGEDEMVKNYLRGPDANYLKRLEKYPALLREAEQMKKFSGAHLLRRPARTGRLRPRGLPDERFRRRRNGFALPRRPFVSRQAGFALPRTGGQAKISGGKSVSAVNRISANELKGYGTIAGQRRAENPRLIDVSLIIEKPAVAVAREKLRVNDLPAETWLGWFGMHLLAPSIYEILGEMIRDNVRDNGEFQLTRAQEIQRQRKAIWRWK